MPFPNQALRYSMPPKVRGSITTDSIAATAPTTFDLAKSNARETPRTPAAAVVGTGGAVNFGYKVCALGPGGKETAATAEVTTSSGSNAVLSATDYNLITWMEVEGAEGYTVYRHTGSVTYPAGLVGRVGVDSYHTTAGYCAFKDTGITRLNAETAPTTDYSYVLDNDLPHYIYIENLGAVALLVALVKAPNATVADDKAELVLEESVAAGSFTTRFSIAALGNRMFSATHGMRWLSLEAASSTTTAYIELA